MRAIALLFISSLAIAGPKQVPPPEVLARFERNVDAEIRRNSPGFRTALKIEANRWAAEAPTEPRGSPQSDSARVNDILCTSVEKYALALGMLHTAGISLDDIPRQKRDLGFDTIAVQNAMYNSKIPNWGEAVAFVRWNCDQFGVENLKTSLAFIK